MHNTQNQDIGEIFLLNIITRSEYFVWYNGHINRSLPLMHCYAKSQVHAIYAASFCDSSIVDTVNYIIITTIKAANLITRHNWNFSFIFVINSPRRPICHTISPYAYTACITGKSGTTTGLNYMLLYSSWCQSDYMN